MKGMFVQGEKWDQTKIPFGTGRRNVHLPFSSLLEVPMMEKEQMPFLFSWEMHSQHMELEPGKLRGVWGCPFPCQPSLVPSPPCPAGSILPIPSELP